MNQSLVLSNLTHRPMRTTAAVTAIALEVALILVVIGLTRGIISESSKRVAGIGADLVLRPPDTSYLLATSAAALSTKLRDVLADVEGVESSTPVLTQFNTQGGLDVIYGIDLESFNRVSRGFLFVEGTGFEDEADVVVDDVYANAKKLKVGDTVTFLNNSFQVRGIVEHGKGSRVFLPIKTLQDLIGAPDKATLIFIRSADGESNQEVISRIKAKLPGYQVLPMNEFVSLMTTAGQDLAPLRYFLRFVTGTASLVGFFVIFLSMYTATTERTREIGILKSLGASKLFVGIVFFREALVLCSLGVLIGIGMAFGGRLLLGQLFPSLHVEFGSTLMIQAVLLAASSAVLGSLYPALRAASQDAIEALAYE
ncbi:MAG: ABC transporter permease [Acidobacteriota bacterium]